MRSILLHMLDLQRYDFMPLLATLVPIAADMAAAAVRGRGDYVTKIRARNVLASL